MPNTAKASVLTEYLIEQIDIVKNDFGIKRVYYGDQEYIPEVPAVCVEPAIVARELSGVPLKTTNDFNVSILIYAANIEGVEDAQRGADQKTEAVIDHINTLGVSDTNGGVAFGGLVIFGYVQSSEYGYVVKQNKLMRANRCIVYARSRTILLEA